MAEWHSTGCGSPQRVGEASGRAWAEREVCRPRGWVGGGIIGEGTVAALGGWLHSGVSIKYINTLRRRVSFLPVREGRYKHRKETKLE